MQGVVPKFLMDICYTKKLLRYNQILFSITDWDDTKQIILAPKHIWECHILTMIFYEIWQQALYTDELIHPTNKFLQQINYLIHF
jgi:hypothetical protein